MTKFSCNGKLLKQILSIINTITISNPIQMSMNSIAITGDKIENTLKINFFNLSEGVQVTIPAENIESKFELLLSASSFSKIVSQIQSTVIEFECDTYNNFINIYTELGVVTLDLMNYEYSLDFPKCQKEKSLVIDIEQLQPAIKRVTPCAGKGLSETSEVLTSIHFKNSQHNLSLYTTNGTTLAKASILSKSNNDAKANITQRFLKLLAKVIAEFKITGGTIQISLDETNSGTELTIENDLGVIELIIVGRVIYGCFPDVDKIIPSEFPYEISLDREALLNALNLIECIKLTKGSNKIFNNPNMAVITVDDNNFNIFYEGDGKQKIDTTLKLATSNLNEPFKLGLNIEMLKKHLTVLDNCQYIVLKLISPVKPVLIKGYNNFITEFGIIMPIQLDI